MDYPYARHAQRYEYPGAKGFITNKTVMDIGCGATEEPVILSIHAKLVFAVDTIQLRQSIQLMVPKNCQVNRIVKVPCSVYKFYEQCDVAVAIEVFEHVSNPKRFINHIADHCKELFITTPLAKITGKTSNPDHVKEYSNRSFRRCVETRFDIIEQKFQLSNLEVVDNAQPNGDSYNTGHVVQMLWCRRHNG